MNAHFRLFSAYTLPLIDFFVRRTTAEHVLPIFMNLWYDDVADVGTDACGVHAFGDYNFAASPYDLVMNDINEIDLRDGCTWNYSSFHFCGNYTDYPIGFTTLNMNDWEKILQDPSAALEGCYSMKAACQSGSTSMSTIATPFYDCPPNSRLSYDNVTFEMGCTTTPTPCLADIVGRDLSSDGLEDIGHVGLVASFNQSNPMIMEVLNGTNPDISGIFLDPLYGEDSFTTKTKYWGSRYEPQNFTRLPLTLASQVIQAGLDQQHYVFNYTLDLFYYPGGTEEHPDNCQFRCDTFVYYCYDAGAQIKLQTEFVPYMTYPWTIFYDFMCSADPVEYCSAYTTVQQTTLALPDDSSKIKPYTLRQPLGYVQNTTTLSTQKIFQSLRFALATKLAQKEQLPMLIEEYQSHSNASTSGLFIRCLCFELKKMAPTQINEHVRSLLSDLLWQHKYLSSDNFLLALMENSISFYLENPHCDWLSAFFTVRTETQEDKEAGMMAYVDQQDNVTEKANLVTSSRFSVLSTLTDEKRRAYGRLFQQAYHTDNSLPERAKKLIWLSLSEMKTSAAETTPLTQFFKKSNTTINRSIQRKFSP